MPQWLNDVLEKSSYFMPHGHCYLWIPSLLWMHVISDLLIGVAYMGISILLYALVRRIRLPFSPVFIAFGLFIGLCGLTHFMSIWTVWNPDYFVDGLLKAATAAASVATAIGLLFVRPQVESVVHAARLSETRRIDLESKTAELETLYRKVKELDELKTQFFANVSHELRTPLSLILGPAQRVLSDQSVSVEHRAQLEVIVRNATTLLNHVNDLLDVAKLEAGALQPQYAAQDIAALTRRVASQFEFASAERHLSYCIDAPARLDAQVDAGMFERVLVNLLSNAFKFTPSAGDIKVALRTVEDEFELLVQDSGPGVPIDQREVIFERFHQVDGGADRRHGGTGLGLAIVKDFVELHGGRVAVDSAPSGGARFAVRWPLRAPQGVLVLEGAPAETTAELAAQAALHQLATAVDASARAELDGDPSAPAVLIVEDNREMSDFIAGVLSSRCRVATARDGKEGLARAAALAPDLIVSDLMMPGMSGEALVKELRARPEHNATPILLLTAKADEETRVQLLRSGAQDYLTKPFLAEELLARAGNLLAAKRAADTLRAEAASASTSIEQLAGEIASKHRQLKIAVEAAELASAQAQRASAVKTSFLGLISHELRTPISTIHTNIELLKRLAGQPNPALSQKAVERLARACRQAATTIEGLLEYTRLESGRLDIRAETVDAHALAAEVVESMADQTDADVQLRLAPRPADLAPVSTDPRLVRVILNNLISNALKFTRAGTVTVRVGGASGDQMIEVRDTGVGIAEADLRRIFEPFEQLEPVQRKTTPGVGLGLSLVKELVRAVNGRIEVESRIGEGSTFRVWIPGT